jgi:ABC-type histidine transport system ATPase subunit
MAFWSSKPITDPEKQLKKLRKYCMQVLGMSKPDAEKKAREWLDNVGKKAKSL